MKSKAIWWMVGTALIVIAVAAVILARRNPQLNAATKISNQFVHAVQASNADTSYQLLTKGAQYAIDKSNFSSSIKAIGPALNGSQHISSRHLDQTAAGSSALVIYDINGTDNVIYTFKISLILENGRWQVIDFKSDKKI